VIRKFRDPANTTHVDLAKKVNVLIDAYNMLFLIDTYMFENDSFTSLMQLYNRARAELDVLQPNLYEDQVDKKLSDVILP
jgi:hypothetical protein